MVLENRQILVQKEPILHIKPPKIAVLAQPIPHDLVRADGDNRLHIFRGRGCGGCGGCHLVVCMCVCFVFFYTVVTCSVVNFCIGTLNTTKNTSQKNMETETERKKNNKTGFQRKRIGKTKKDRKHNTKHHVTMKPVDAHRIFLKIVKFWSQKYPSS